MENHEKKKDNTYYLPFFMCIGISVGMAIGAVLDSIPIGMCIGLCIGVGVGTVLDGKNRKKEDDPKADLQ